MPDNNHAIPAGYYLLYRELVGVMRQLGRAADSRRRGDKPKVAGGRVARLTERCGRLAEALADVEEARGR